MKSDDFSRFYAPQKGYYQFVGDQGSPQPFGTLERSFLLLLGDGFYTVGGIIRHFRQLADLSQRELAEKAGIDSAQVSRYESGEKSPRPETLRLLQSVFGEDFGTALKMLQSLREALGFNAQANSE